MILIFEKVLAKEIKKLGLFPYKPGPDIVRSQAVDAGIQYYIALAAPTELLGCSPLSKGSTVYTTPSIPGP